MYKVCCLLYSVYFLVYYTLHIHSAVPYFGRFLKKLSSFAEDLWVVLTKNGQQFFLKNFKA